jgi:hypothetical protein
MANAFAAAALVGVVSGTILLFTQSSTTLSIAQSSTKPSAQSSTKPLSAQTFNVCVGGFWNPLKGNKCEPYDIYVFCQNPDNPPYKSAATNACREAGKSGQFTAHTLRYVPDDHCGYANVRITCE